MESSYGVGVQNRYEVNFDEDVDPLDFIKTQIKPAAKNLSDEKENKEKSNKSKVSSNKKTSKNEVNTKSSDKNAQGKIYL